MSLQSIGGSIDPVGWARRPRSQIALDFLRRGSERGDERLRQILADHKESRVCDETGLNLLERWNNGRWVLAECR